MTISILGVKRKGEKDFSLKSENEMGFNISCFKKGKAVKIYNILEIVWLNRGWNVMLDPMLDESFNFNEFDDVDIRKAERMEGKEMEIFYTSWR